MGIEFPFVDNRRVLWTKKDDMARFFLLYNFGLPIYQLFSFSVSNLTYKLLFS